MNPRATRRTLFGLIAAMASTAATIALGTALPAVASDGLAIMELHAYAGNGNATAIYGGPVTLDVEAYDDSGSCRNAFDCDWPEGTVYFLMTDLNSGAQYYLGTRQYEHSLLYYHSEAIMEDLYLPAGDYGFDFLYQGNFDSWDSREGKDIPIQWYQLYNVITVYKRPCDNTLTVRPDTEPVNTAPVLLTVDLGASGHTGYVDITGPTGGRVARVPVNPDGRTASYTLPYQPTETMSFQATYSGDANNYGCTSAQATYTVPVVHTGGGVVYVPAPNNDSYTIDIGSTLHADVLTNDLQVPITQKLRLPTQLEFNSNAGLTPDVQYLAPPDPATVGTVTIEDDDTITFVPSASWDGTQFAFTYVAYDADTPERSAQARVYIEGRCAVGVADSYDVQPDTPRTVAGTGVFANDTGKCAGDALVVTPPAHGQLGLNGNGSFTYTPNAGYLGVDTFEYRASSDPANRPVQVLLSVLSGACVPTLSADAYDVGSHSLTIADPGVTANDSLCRGVVAVASPPQHGTVSISPSGGVNYTADPGYVGADSFSYGLVEQVPQQNVPGVRTAVAGAVDPDVAPATVALNVLADPAPSTDPANPSTTTSTTTPTSASTSTPATTPTTAEPVTTLSAAGAGAPVSAGPPSTPPMLIALPATGTSTMSTALLAGSLGMAGVALVRLTRRRRTT